MILTAILASVACQVGGHAPFYKPDNACTPGAYVRKTVADICDGDTDRPSLPAGERRIIITNYGVPGWSGADGELDHRVPLVLGGTTDRRNIWPERGSIPNTKDRLENYVYRRVCSHTMRLRTARIIFLNDWVVHYREYAARGAI